MNEALTVFFLLNLLDILTTVSGLRSGAVEQNPLVKFILKLFGVPGLYSFKMIIGGIILIMAWIMHNYSCALSTP